MHWNNLRRFALSFLAILLMASPAEANVMIPLIAYTWIGMVLALVPVIVVETLILSARVGLTFWHSAGVVTTANLASTLIGIPIAFLLLLLPRPNKKVDYRKKIQWWKFRAVMRDWLLLGPMRDHHPENKRLLIWTGIAAGLLLPTACFTASWLSEFWVASFMVDGVPSRILSDGMFSANLASYGILIALIACVVVWDSLRRTVNRRARKQTQKRKKMSSSFRQIKTRSTGQLWHAANPLAPRGVSQLKSAEENDSHKRPVLIEGQASIIRIAEDAHEDDDYSLDGESTQERRVSAGG